MGRFARVVVLHPCFKVGRVADISLFGVGCALNNVDVVHGGKPYCGLAPAPLRLQATQGMLRLSLRSAFVMAAPCKALSATEGEAWWPDSESNRGHKDFQSFALPTELSGRVRDGP